MRIPLTFSWLAASSWALACTALSTTFASAPGVLAVLLGSFLGSALGDYAVRHGRIRRTGLLTLGAALLLPSIVEHLSFAGAAGLTAQEAADLGPKAMVAIWFMRIFSGRWAWFRAIEALLAGLAFSQWMAAHRYGNMQRPYWMMDAWIEAGRAPSDLLWLAGALGLLVVTGLLLAGTPRPARRTAILATLGLALLAVLLTRLLPPLPFSPPTPPPPPKSLSPEPPPPPPPQAKPIALIQLDDFHHPPERLGGYYLRTMVFDRLDGAAFAQTAATVETKPDFPGTSGAPGLVRSTVFLLDATNLLPVLLNGFASESLPTPAPPFRQAARCISAPPGGPRHPDLDLSTFRQQLVDTNWTPAEAGLYLHTPADSNLQALASEVVQDIPPALAEYLPPRVKLIRHWMNHHLAYSARAGEAADSGHITNFLFGTRTGGTRQFAAAAVLLFRCAGVPSRLAGGYVVPVTKDETLSQFVVADTHAQQWPEVYLAGTGWIPVPLNPTNVLDRPQPLPEPELEKSLEKLAEPPARVSHSRWDTSACVRWGLLGLAAALLAWALLGLHRRYLSIMVARPHERHRHALDAALALARCAGWERRSGETYLDFAVRVQTEDVSRDKRFSSLLMDLVFWYRASYETGAIRPAKDWLKLIAKLDVLVLRYYPVRNLLPFPWRSRRPQGPGHHTSSRGRTA